MAWQGSEGSAHVRSDLIARVEALKSTDQSRCGALANDLEALRRIAARAGIAPAVTVIHAIDSALSRGERGPLISGWLTILRDAVDCETYDARTCATYAAACTVRLNG